MDSLRYKINGKPSGKRQTLDTPVRVGIEDRIPITHSKEQKCEPRIFRVHSFAIQLKKQLLDGDALGRGKVSVTLVQ